MDQGRRDTNRKLSEIEKRIQKEYAQAQRELTQKMDSHFNAFQAKDEEWRRKLHDGEVTEEQYRKWRTGQMAIGKRWQEMRDTVAEDLVNTTQIAKSIANGYMPEVYALNANYATYEIEKETQMDTSFTLYNAQAVERLIKDDPEVLKPPGKQMEDKIAKGEAVRWEKGQIQSVTIQTILQGESVKNMAKRISRDLCVKDKNAALRYARTAVNGAENAGRLDSFRRAKAMGIDLKKMWIASPDGRTRDWHVDLDGQTVDIEKPFTNELGDIMYPGDSAADPANVWNCRCTMVSQIKGFERNPADLNLRPYHKLGSMTYEEWKEAHRKKKEGEQSRAVVNGRDISHTWNRRPEQFDFAIEDIINAQGFDGLPRVVSAEEFDRLSAENGIICKRGYAVNYETGKEDPEDVLDRYHEELISGKWYVDCHAGSAAYGQGMYSYKKTGNINDTSVMDDAVKMYSGENGRVETFTFDKNAKIIKSDEIKALKEKENSLILERAQTIFESSGLSSMEEDIAKRMAGILPTWGKDGAKAFETFENMTDEQREEIQNVVNKYNQRLRDEKNMYSKMDDGVFAALKGYDAIEANYDLGDNTKEFVILNRTKVVFKGE